MESRQEISNAARTAPLQGKVILVTRAVNQAKKFSGSLRALGANVVEFPAIRIGDPESWDEVDGRIRNIARYDGIIFTSVNAVENFFRRFDPVLMPRLDEKIICAVGTKTRQALINHQCAVTIVPKRYTAGDLVAALTPASIGGKLFLHPRGNRGRNIVAAGLAECGAHVDECIVYTTEYADPENADIVLNLFKSRSIHLVTFFSPSSVKGFFQTMHHFFPEHELLSDMLHHVQMAVIGTVTADALLAEGISPSIVPPLATGEALIDSIIRHYTA